MQAIITGGNRGIGLETTRKLLAKGFHVHILSRSGMEAPLEGTTCWTVDMADYSKLLETVEAIEAIGPVDVLVNNAGYMNPKTAADYDEAAILAILQVNLINAVRLSIHLAQKMVARGGGRIVSLASIAGEIGHPDIWYGISKAGLANAMRSLARSHGPRGVMANSVAPGPVDTEMMKNIPIERKTRLMSTTISQRFGTAEEVAEVVCWLATDAPIYLNGDTIDLNNGMNYR